MALAIAAIVLSPARAEQQAPKPANIDRNGVLILIRSTLLALDQANKTGNYTVLRDIGAPGFQATRRASRRYLCQAAQRQSRSLGLSRIDPQLRCCRRSRQTA